MPEPASPGPRGGVLVGADGVPRCAWAANATEYLAYHDDEWGVQVHGERELYERLTLEAFQSGLSWLTILRKREGFRAAFDGFDPEIVAGYGPADRARLLADPAIVRNSRKIDAAVTNAAAVLALREGEGLDALVWRHVPTPLTRAQQREVPTMSPESVALAKALRAHGFVFVGPTTVYAAMQACGLVDDHVRGCHRAGGSAA